MSKLKIGWSLRDISTDKPVNLAGQFHMRISKGVAEPIYATALAIDGGEDYVIFTTIENVSTRTLLDPIREAIRNLDPSIDPFKIIINATHTHTAPATVMNQSEIDAAEKAGTHIASAEEYRQFLIGQAAETICEAWQTRTAGKIGYGYGFAVVAHSRCVTYFDDVSLRPGAKDQGPFLVNGHGVMYGNTDDDNFSGYEAGADAFLNLLFTFDPAGKLTGAIVNIPCPAQNSEMEYMISADYWADVREALHKKYGDIFILPQCAAAGDLSPRILHYKAAQNRRFRLKYGENIPVERAARKDIAQRVAAGFDEVLSWAKNDLFDELPVKHIATTVQLKKRDIFPDELKTAQERLTRLQARQFMSDGLSPDELVTHNSLITAELKRCNTLISRSEEFKTQPMLPMEMHVVKIGNIAFATNRFELYMDYMHRIQARSPFEQTFIVQLCGCAGKESGSYLCTQRGFENKGYSASPFCNRVSVEGGQQLVEETVKILKEIY